VVEWLLVVVLELGAGDRVVVRWVEVVLWALEDVVDVDVDEWGAGCACDCAWECGAIICHDGSASLGFSGAGS